MSKSKFILIAACGLLSACSSNYSGPRYVPRPDIPLNEYTHANAYEDRIDRQKYNRYEERESCQHYRRLPRHSVELSNCIAVKAPPAPVVVAQQQTVTTTTTQNQLLPIVHTYTVHFNFDRSDIRKDQVATLDQISDEIEKYSPAQITVTGFTDTSGSVRYNQKLSERRAHSVTKALKSRHIVSQEVDEEGRGKTELAVPTGDGVKLEANRRVVVDFRR